jgi:septal ring factor EnvC (AmiA/AmiB activator)
MESGGVSLPNNLDHYFPIGTTILIVLYVIGSLKWFCTMTDLERTKSEIRAELFEFKNEIARSYLSKADIERKLQDVYNNITEMKRDLKQDMKDLKQDMQQMISGLHELIDSNRKA